MGLGSQVALGPPVAYPWHSSINPSLQVESNGYTIGLYFYLQAELSKSFIGYHLDHTLLLQLKLSSS